MRITNHPSCAGEEAGDGDGNQGMIEATRSKIYSKFCCCSSSTLVVDLPRPTMLLLTVEATLTTTDHQ
jgi:hypothetical protein